LAARDKTAAGSRDQLWDGLDEWLKPSPLLEVGQAIGISTPTWLPGARRRPGDWRTKGRRGVPRRPS